jgi:hypothetical protein
VGAEGNCSRTQLPMRAVEISAEARAELRAIIPRLAGSRAKGAEFASFGAWVDEQGPFEYVLDGANIGFFGQGKVAKTHKAAAFSYEQVDAVLRCVCARSERVLLVLHVSHTEDASLGLDALKLVRAWRERGLLFSSPTKHNDDWCAPRGRTPSLARSRRLNLEPQPSPSPSPHPPARTRYWLYAAMASGERCKVVSNDEMRDHHFGMLSPRSFLRWKERHVVHFNFCKKKQNLEPELEYPPAYSIAVQDHPTPGHPGRSWLFPCSEPAGGKEGGAREWLLVRPAEAVEAEAGEAEGVSAAAKETVAAAIS